ncbi:MAG: amidase, partial [Paracoccaceae bacterium]
MTELTKLTIAAARDALRKGDVTSAELTQACLTAIDGADALNAFVHKTPEVAMAQAKSADDRGYADAPGLQGIPLGIKDLFCTKGVASQAASRILDGFRPEYESTVTSQLFDRGAVMLGKLNMDEFAMGSSNETSVYGDAVNPWRVDENLTPGGSSGGSIRQPAAFTGITGVKPTYGRVSRWGIVAFASSLDQAGPMTKDVRDAAIMLEAMCG